MTHDHPTDALLCIAALSVWGAPALAGTAASVGLLAPPLSVAVGVAGMAAALVVLVLHGGGGPALRAPLSH